MIETALILILGVVLIGFLWVLGVAISARREANGSAAAARTWGLRALFRFGGLVAVDLAFGLSGVLARFDLFPPPFLFFFVLNIAVAVYVGFSKFGTLLIRNLTFSALIGFQAFRILAEMLLLVGHQAGLTPVQLTLEGYNYDIVTGLTALPVAYYLRRRENRALIWTWNLMGVAFLAAITVIAALSMPTPFRAFPEAASNVWVTRPPFVLLPGILVTAAIAGHVLAFRKLLSGTAEPTRSKALQT